MPRTLIVISLALLPATWVVAEDWSQWAGPRRSFAVESELADRWPEAGPRILWRRPLGNGHAGIVTAGTKLFTAYGGGRRETVVALDRSSGRTLWERSYDVGYAAHREDWDGPHATPLVVGDRLITVAIDATVRAWNVEDGELAWTRDLRADHRVKLPQSGYAASPLAWKGLILLPGLGGPGPGALALRLDNGRTAWARHEFRSSHASPVLVRFAGRDHAVFHGMNELHGLDPASGDRTWSHVLRQNAADNVSFTPLWDASRQQLLLSHGYDDAGMRAIRLRADEGIVRTEELWANRRLRVDHGNGVRLGGVVLASHRSDPGILVAIDVTDGALLWRHRIPKVTGLRAGDKLLLLDEDGSLHLARPDRDGPGVLASARILENNAWTVPSLVGKRLYARDRFHIVALELP